MCDYSLVGSPVYKWVYPHYSPTYGRPWRTVARTLSTTFDCTIWSDNWPEIWIYGCKWFVQMVRDLERTGLVTRNSREVIWMNLSHGHRLWTPLCDCSSKSILCREVFNNQVDQMICFMNVSQPLSLTFACLFNGLKNKVVIVAGMEALHVPNNIDFPLPRLTQLWLPPNA